ncbi:hypothetical protein Hypma_008905 [Hypsizygus marmoreus]|uniref:Uncharacterized protein n=1 Tax=Hypsizygus marmoreus TaxID=39966 RepID=A0A369JTU4_HYPMA|nr:hypothetical protein Hypma_008905 [Hypsizygus marmoreus]
MTGFLTLATWRAVATPLHIVAIGSTAFRICHRHRKRQLWWDDYWAAISLCFDAIYMITPWLRDDEWGESTSLMCEDLIATELCDPVVSMPLSKFCRDPWRKTALPNRPRSD